MASSMEGRYDLQYTSLTAAITVFVTGIMTQSFIIAVNVIEWIKGKPRTEVDKILTSLMAARTSFLVTSMVNVFLIVFWKKSLNFRYEVYNYFMLHSLNLSDIWLTSLFSVVFCLKLCNLRNPLIMHLKTMIFRKVVLLIIASVVVSVFFTSVCFWIDKGRSPDLLMQNNTINNTQSSSGIQIHIFEAVVISVPFFIYCPASLFVFVFLCIHMKRLKCTNNGAAHVDTYYKPLKLMLFAFICFSLRIAANLVVLCNYSFLNIMWTFIIWNSFPTFHSILVIYRTNKLRETVFSILRLRGNS